MSWVAALRREYRLAAIMAAVVFFLVDMIFNLLPVLMLQAQWFKGIMSVAAGGGEVKSIYDKGSR